MQDDIAVLRIGVDAAGRLADIGNQALIGRLLGQAHARAGDYDEVVRKPAEARTLEVRDRHGQAHTHQALAHAWEVRGDDQRALHHAALALDLYQELGDATWGHRR